MVRAAGLRVIEQHIHEERSLLSKWMWAEEFDDDRIAATKAFIDMHGHETGMQFEHEGEDYSFTRRRLMLLAERI
jgi:hypothetical protein